MQTQLPLVSIVIVNYRQADVTLDLLASLRQISYPNVEVWLVDNGSIRDEKAHFENAFPGIKVLVSAENLGFAGGNNLALRQAGGAFLLLLNNDTIVPAGFLEPLVDALFQHPEAGMASPKIYYHDAPTVLQYAGTAQVDMRTGRGFDPAKGTTDAGQYNQPGTTNFAHGACMMVRREVLETIGLLAEDYFLYYEELDFSEKARRHGWSIRYVPQSHIWHKESVSTGKFSPLKTYYMYRNRWTFVRRFAATGVYWQFVVYFLGFAVPLNLALFAIKREWKHLRALWQGVRWHFLPEHKRPTVFS